MVGDDRLVGVAQGRDERTDDRLAVDVGGRQPAGADLLGVGGVGDRNAFHREGDQVVAVVVVPHGVDVGAQGREGVLARHLAGLDDLFETRGHPLCAFHEGAQLADPVVHHPLVQERRGDGDRHDEGERGEPDEKAEFPGNRDPLEHVGPRRQGGAGRAAPTIYPKLRGLRKK